VELDESDENAWVGYAEALLEKQQPQEALDAYRQALDVAPNSASTYFRQAKALLALGRADESIRSLKTAFRLDPTKKEEFRRAYPDLYQNDRVRQLLDLDQS
jgi:tetratricopeptide (TPR) repeat protein